MLECKRGRHFLCLLSSPSSNTRTRCWRNVVTMATETAKAAPATWRVNITDNSLHPYIAMISFEFWRSHWSQLISCHVDVVVLYVSHVYPNYVSYGSVRNADLRSQNQSIIVSFTLHDRRLRRGWCKFTGAFRALRSLCWQLKNYTRR